jgi:hypothetical protein
MLLSDRPTERVYDRSEYPVLIEPGKSPKEVLYYWGDGMDVTVYQVEVTDERVAAEWKYSAWKGSPSFEAKSVRTPWMRDIEDAAYLAMYSPRLEVNVHNGAARLDEVYEGWAAAVDPSAIDQSVTSGCVTAQLFGSYQKGLEALGIEMSDAAGAFDHGLTITAGWLQDLISDHARMEAHQMLDAYWGREIARRVVWQSDAVSVEQPERGTRVRELAYWGISPADDRGVIEQNLDRIDPDVVFTN